MVFIILQIVVSILLIGLILMQMQGSGLSSSFGGGGEFYRSRRSFEKLLIWATIGVSGFFAIFSLILLISH